MELKVLGDTGIRLSAIGLGTAALGGGRGVSSVQDNRKACTVIHSALDNGINWVDTSPYYGCGHVESVVGEVASERRHEVFIATRCGMAVEGDHLEVQLDPLMLRREVEGSLRRLQTESIDLVMIQHPSSDADTLLAAWETLVDLQEEGKVRTIGLANASLAQLKACHVWHHVDVVQPEYHMLRREIESEHLISYCQHQQIGILAHSPLAGGLLSGSFESSGLPRSDWRRTQIRFREPQISRNMDFVNRLRPIAEKYNKTVGQLALAWVLRHGAQVFTAAGAHSVGQLEQNIAGADWMLSAEDLRMIDMAIIETGAC